MIPAEKTIVPIKVADNFEPTAPALTTTQKIAANAKQLPKTGEKSSLATGAGIALLLSSLALIGLHRKKED